MYHGGIYYFFSKIRSHVTTSECESSTQAASELNESNVLNDFEIEGSECDDLGDLAALSLTDVDDELNDIVNEETPTAPQVDNSSHVSLPTGSKDCGILLQADLSVEQKLEIVLNFSKYNPSPTYNFPTKIEYGKNRAFQH